MSTSRTSTRSVITGVLLVAAVTALAAAQLVGDASSGGTTDTVTVAAQASPKPTKTATADPPRKSLTVTGSLDVTGLAPGVSVVRTVTVGNPNGQDVELQSVTTVVTGPSPAPLVGSCTSPADFDVTVAGYNASTGVGSPVTIPRNSSRGLPVTVRMHNSATRNQDPCKGRSWTFAFTATATGK